MYVSNIKELKAALASNADQIEITDEGLARKIRIIKSATTPALAAAIAAAGVGAAMWWNPVGWAAAAVTITADGAILFAVAFFIATMSVALLWALFNDWEIEASAEATSNGSGAKVSLKLKPKKK